MTNELILVLGGARAGKSDFAQGLAERGNRVLLVATAEARDEEMAQRIAAHRQRRPAQWDTLEEPVDLAASLGPVVREYDTVLLDCLTLWVSNLMGRREGTPDSEPDTRALVEQLLQLYEGGSATWIVVSNEVGWGVVPPPALGRAFIDALGLVNQMVAARADRVYFMAAGLALELKALGARPLYTRGSEGTR